MVLVVQFNEGWCKLDTLEPKCGENVSHVSGAGLGAYGLSHEWTIKTNQIYAISQITVIEMFSKLSHIFYFSKKGLIESKDRCKKMFFKSFEASLNMRTTEMSNWEHMASRIWWEVWGLGDDVPCG